MTWYAEHKAACIDSERCVQRGCWTKAVTDGDDPSDYCAYHRDNKRARNAAHMRRKRLLAQIQTVLLLPNSERNRL